MTARRTPFMLFAVVLLILSVIAPALAEDTSQDREPFEDEMSGTDEGISPGMPENDLVLEPLETNSTQGWNPDTGIYEMIFPHLAGEGYYSDTFGACRGTGCSRRHEGIDIMAPKMTPVVAVASGTVYWMHDEQGGDCCAMGVRHDDNWVSYYIHLNNDTPGTDDGQGFGFAPGVVNGAHLEAGQLIGWVGDSGNAENTGSHTHYELHEPSGTVINPYEHLNAAAVISEPYVATEVRGCDFDDDGYDDLVIGEPSRDRSGPEDTGEVVVLPGSLAGPTKVGTTVWNQATSGVDNFPEAGDGFGAATACGDFDNDGYDDLVVGVPDEDQKNVDAGAINVLYGSASGLEPSGDNYWHQNRFGVPDKGEEGDRLGAALAVGDFDGDGYDDVAVGAPGEEVATKDGAGMVLVFSGSSAGIDGSDVVRWMQSSRGIPGKPIAGNGFGSALAAGDFDGDGYHDLAIGIPGRNFSGAADAGMVMAMLGSETGLSTSGLRRFSQGAYGMEGARAGSDLLGSALGVGDFDGSGHDDLAIGIPGDRVGGVEAGAVAVVYGADGGLSPAGNQLWHADSPDVPGGAAGDQRFGAAVTAGETNGDGYFDVVVGAPGNAGGAGAIFILSGGDTGVTADGSRLIHQNTKDVKNVAQAGDGFGAHLGVGNFDGLGLSWIAVGIPGEDLGVETDPGAVQTLRGRLGGITGSDSALWSRSTAGIPGKLQSNAFFGAVGRAGA